MAHFLRIAPTSRSYACVVPLIGGGEPLWKQSSPLPVGVSHSNQYDAEIKKLLRMYVAKTFSLSSHLQFSTPYPAELSVCAGGVLTLWRKKRSKCMPTIMALLMWASAHPFCFTQVHSVCIVLDITPKFCKAIKITLKHCKAIKGTQKLSKALKSTKKHSTLLQSSGMF